MCVDFKLSICNVQVPVSDGDQTPHKLGGDAITINLLIDAEAAHNVLERGPPADDPTAQSFRNFWGEKSNLRRFMDGAICEAVVWEANSVCEKRNLLSQIIPYILQRSVQLPSPPCCFTTHYPTVNPDACKIRAGSLYSFTSLFLTAALPLD